MAASTGWVHVRCRAGTERLRTASGTRQGGVSALVLGSVIGVIGSVLLLPLPGHAQATAFGTGQDDFNLSQLTNLSTIFSSATITTALQTAGFTAANNWNFTFAGAANSAFINNDLSNPLYKAWVVNSPDVVGLDGTTRNRNVVNQDGGGAVYQVKYTPGAGDPTSIHFIQAYAESFNGGATSISLDNGGAATPWYDALGVSGIQTLAGNASWMQDTPYDIEPEVDPETINFTSNVQFDNMVAVDTVNAGVHNVTIYGGQHWGYVFSTAEAPEPSGILLLTPTAFSLMGMVIVRRRRRA